MNRRIYWCCTKLADWIRGTPKPRAATAREWFAWKRKAKANHPWRFWFAETFLSEAQRFLSWPFDKLRHLKNYINNRWFLRTHSLTAHPRDIEPGSWCDFGNRMLPCLFNELVDFVEVEKAWFFCAWNDEEKKKYGAPQGFLAFGKWRSPEAGLAYLDWASSLKSEDGTELTEQALAAIETKKLYLWWKEERPKRPSPDDASGYSDLFNARLKKGDDEFDLFGRERSEEEEAKIHLAIDATRKIEARYDAEDEKMMIRLIKLRNHLWT